MKTNQKIRYAVVLLMTLSCGILIYILFVQKKVHVLEIINHSGEKIECLAVWERCGSCQCRVVHNEESVVMRHEISSEGGTLIFFRKPNTNQWFFQSGDDYYTPGMSSTATVVIGQDIPVPVQLYRESL